MALTIDNPLPSAQEVADKYPVTREHRIDERREEVKRILQGDDRRLVMIVGPCSAWPSEAVEHYAEKLAALQEKVREEILLVLRTYIQKPRTTIGWPGPLNQPDPFEPVDIAKGILECRRLMATVGKMLPLADEMLFTHNTGHFEPLLSYVAVGARSAEDMEHRYLASGLECAVGMKHPTSGDIQVGVNSVLSAQHPHVFAHNNHQVSTTGNASAHLILRGGGGRSNYDPESIAKAMHLMTQQKIKHPAIIVDASHDNSINGSGKDHALQGMVVEAVMGGIRRQREEYRGVKGFMLESFFIKGSQKVQPGNHGALNMGGQSITDPCMGWEETEKLIRQTADALTVSSPYRR